MAFGLSHIPKIERRAILLSISAGIALLGLKFAAYFLTGSTAIFADALEGIVNITASLSAAYALMLAHLPADEDHPYGHGKVEFFSAGFEGGMIVLAAIVAIVKAVDSIARKVPLQTQNIAVGLLLMFIALAANAFVGAYLIRTGKKNSSLTLEADGWHLITDAITSAVAVVTLVLVKISGMVLLDPIAAILVSLYIAFMGVRLVRRSIAGLMDKQDASDEAMFRSILDSHCGATGLEPKICSYHKLRHRHSGRYHWVDFHLVVPKWWDIERGHRVASAIEYAMEQAVGEGNATAHVEPCDDKDCSYCEQTRSEMAVES